ncbi:MAG: hypothetical protein HC821_00215 [Lewinella sp.]|nr:hypothetical protein [Lewinella sp.]
MLFSDNSTNNLNGRNLFLQDGNAGITVRFAANHTFPIGTDLEVAVSGLELSEFNGLLQVNNVPLANAGSQGAGTLPTPRSTTVAQLLANAEAWESTLVKIDPAALTGAATLGNNLTVTDPSGSVSLFTFNTATFASTPVPSGNIALTAIVSSFNGPQLVIRNASDVVGGNTGGGGGGGGELITAAELRTLFAGGATAVPAGKTIEGVVISDFTPQNITGRNLVLQTGESGIVVRLTANHSFPLNANLRVNIGGLELSEFNGLLQINNVPNANASSSGAGTSPTPREATVQQILANAEAWESTLVRISNATFSGANTYEGTLNVTDGSGSTIFMFTRGQATFAATSRPTTPVTLTAILGQFNDLQLNLRNLADVVQ